MVAFEAEQSDALAEGPFNRCLIRRSRAVVEAVPVAFSCRCEAFAEAVTIVLRIAKIRLMDILNASTPERFGQCGLREAALARDWCETNINECLDLVACQEINHLIESPPLITH